MKKETKYFWALMLLLVAVPVALVVLWHWMYHGVSAVFETDSTETRAITASEAVIDREDCETYCHNVGGMLVGITRHRTSEEIECMCEVYVDEEGYDD